MKEEYTLYDDEYKLMRMLMLLQPIKFNKLAFLCDKELGWKNSTTSSVIDKLVKQGLICLQYDKLTSLVSSDQIFMFDDEDNKKEAVTPAFVTYLGGKQLSESDALEIIELIEGTN